IYLLFDSVFCQQPYYYYRTVTVLCYLTCAALPIAICRKVRVKHDLKVSSRYVHTLFAGRYLTNKHKVSPFVEQFRAVSPAAFKSSLQHFTFSDELVKYHQLFTSELFKYVFNLAVIKLHGLWRC